MPSIPRFRHLVLLGATAAAVVLPGCGPEEEATIPRETFVAAYVELRVAALERDDARVPDADRDRILAEHGVTAEDMVAFAEVRGRDPAFMRDVWAEIEERLNVNPADTGPTPTDSTESQ